MYSMVIVGCFHPTPTPAPLVVLMLFLSHACYIKPRWSLFEVSTHEHYNMIAQIFWKNRGLQTVYMSFLQYLFCCCCFNKVMISCALCNLIHVCYCSDSSKSARTSDGKSCEFHCNLFELDRTIRDEWLACKVPGKGRYGVCVP